MSDQNPQTPTFYLQFDCPDCGGVLLPIEEGGFLQFQCEVGHRYSPETLLDAQRERAEYAIWEALRGSVETGRLLRRLAALDGSQQNPSAPHLAWRMQQQEKIVDFLRQALSELNKAEGTE